MNADIIPSFISAMEATGMRPAEPIADRLGPDLIRFACEGDGTGKRNGWAILYTDGRPAGAFGNYRLQIRETWKADGFEPLSPAQRREQAAEYRRQKDEREAARAAGQLEAAERCRERWSRAAAVDGVHPYLSKKRITGEGLKQEGNRLLVPMFDSDGVLWNLQTIWPDGAKRFAKGGRQDELFLVVGQVEAMICIGEGYATCAVARRATGGAVAVAFSANNLTATALACTGMFPDADIVVLADDDAHLVDHPQIRRNVGVDAANAAAAAVGGRVALPPRGVAA